MNSCFIVFLLSLVFSLFIEDFNTEAAPEYLYHVCPNTSLFAPDSTYRSTLHALISSLSTAATHSIYGFATATAGRNPPDQAHGLFLCRGDLDSTTCSRCVATAKRGILERCPHHRVSAIWYDQCMLRYSNQSIFSAMERLPNRVLYSIQNVTDPTRFMQLLRETLNHIAARASAGGSGKKVAAAEANFTRSQKLYALVQCTPDLTASDCVKCLQFGIANLPQGKQGGRLLAPSCNLRYELRPFYYASALPSPAPPPPAPATGPEAQSNKSTVIIIVVAALSVGPAFVFLGWCFGRKNETETDAVQGQGDQTGTAAVYVLDVPFYAFAGMIISCCFVTGRTEITPSEPVQYTLATIRAATGDFSNENKLGSGGFGDVYKGTLSNGQLIAVKRLSQSSKQGTEDFENEVDSLAKVQHRNVVQLLGYCSEGEERLIVYEFVLNGSLDKILFDPVRSRELNWTTRFQIACGIVRGMCYLHEESHPRIIHRDLKPGNILLDSEMKPKISDFGLARILGANQSRVNTSKPAGTIGYIAPENATDWEISVKSDVYSFGVLLLELISGKKNTSFYRPDEGEDIAIHAWEILSDDTLSAMLDPAIGETDSEAQAQVVRCLTIGLLCAQKDPNRRPTMEAVFQGLSPPLTLKLPPQAALVFGRTERPMEELETDKSTGSSMWSATDEMFDPQSLAPAKGHDVP
ncbi:cysteine-rich receptor-like protein kinase 10 [Rhodamnia argentea]|uniref:Cysteine-rich receptor-like protein kinase 10 n=1 Tax=Rhodamnia argentea TaxID=178133 RepID=A0ABM3H6K5_9MYRT|nr:cysteine-rich receptor-like protein kinase 10 [Rhodamnia argentea]